MHKQSHDNRGDSGLLCWFLSCDINASDFGLLSCKQFSLNYGNLTSGVDEIVFLWCCLMWDGQEKVMKFLVLRMEHKLH